ncbi:uncharacterized protein LOC113468320 [Diaphorina citri]|uniref:Uncharacterized protein LOC113468320 n=1 Tax=Diaphorina citri TaxID=121845 RepID=A0A3Q0J1W8_DIACI|nr:uncharacterized protein LOC113468320 [Diaphorina citri]
MYGSPNDPIQTTAQAAQTGIGQVGTTPRSQYLQKRRLQFKIGSRGSEPGCFTWPRGIAVGPDNSIVVADSSNHRVQVCFRHFHLQTDSFSSGPEEMSNMFHELE